jgi:hypothetical protein
MGIDASLIRQLARGGITDIADKFHHPSAHLNPFLRIIGNPELEEHPGKPHDTQTDLSVGLRNLFDLWDRIAIHINDIIQEMDTGPNRLPQLDPIDGDPTTQVTQVFF